MDNTYPSINQFKILCAAEHHLLWFEQKDLVEWLTGSRKRLKVVEYHLPRLVANGKLTAIRYGKKLVYRINHPQLVGSSHLEHDLICTKLMIRLGAHDEGAVVSELFFLEEKEQFRCIPDWAVLYPSMVLLCEFSTADNFRRTRLMCKKLKAYRQYLSRFTDYFENDVSVLFILDAPKHKMKHFIQKHVVLNDTIFYFTNLETMLSVPKAELLTSPFYIWGGDGQEYSLTS